MQSSNGAHGEVCSVLLNDLQLATGKLQMRSHASTRARASASSLSLRWCDGVVPSLCALRGGPTSAPCLDRLVGWFSVTETEAQLLRKKHRKGYHAKVKLFNPKPCRSRQSSSNNNNNNSQNKQKRSAHFRRSLPTNARRQPPRWHAVDDSHWQSS